MANRIKQHGTDSDNGTKVPYGGWTYEEVSKFKLECANEAANIVEDRVFRLAGKGAIYAACWALGIALVGFLSWLGLKGAIK